MVIREHVMIEKMLVKPQDCTHVMMEHTKLIGETVTMRLRLVKRQNQVMMITPIQALMSHQYVGMK